MWLHLPFLWHSCFALSSSSRATPVEEIDMDTLGLYIHIPFCKSKCRYCDFCSFPSPKPHRIEAYLDALCREIEAYGQKEHPYYTDATSRSVDTVYFGGGTPTLLSPNALARVAETLRSTVRIAENVEITAECNPATADLDYFKALRTIGFNRLSIGAQSMQNSELKRLGRLHTADDVRKTVADARAAGFCNVSLDLMFGIPEQTEESLSNTLEEILSLSPDHLSVYGLQIEEGTYFARHQNELSLPDEDTERAMYMQTVETLSKHGLHQYEISNFARPGRESQHNLRYWRRQDYIGLGLAAHSCMGSLRFSNTEALDRYLSGNRRETEERISSHDVLAEQVMLGMRLTEGVDFSALIRAYGDQATRYRDALAAYEAHGLVTADGGRIAFTRDGSYVSNAILSNVLDFEK